MKTWKVFKMIGTGKENQWCIVELTKGRVHVDIFTVESTAKQVCKMLNDWEKEE